jgi:hypothetical protein
MSGILEKRLHIHRLKLALPARVFLRPLWALLAFAGLLGCQGESRKANNESHGAAEVRASSLKSDASKKVETTSPADREVVTINEKTTLSLAVKEAAKLLNTSPQNVRNEYKIRSRRLDEQEDTVMYEFFHLQLVGDRDVDSLGGIFGGFPLYFSLTLDEKSGALVSKYAEPF